MLLPVPGADGVERVMPWTRARYPGDWEEIARAVKERAGWRCERCGHPSDPATGHTLTVHHLDGDPGNNEPGNLVALCQRCHLHVQAVHRPGQRFLPGLEEPWVR